VWFQFSSGVSPAAQVEFIDWLDGFKSHYSALLAANSKAEITINVASELAAAAQGRVRGSWEAATGDPETIEGYACAIAELPEVVELLADVTWDTVASLEEGAEGVAVVGR